MRTCAVVALTIGLARARRHCAIGANGDSAFGKLYRAATLAEAVNGRESDSDEQRVGNTERTYHAGRCEKALLSDRGFGLYGTDSNRLGISQERAILYSRSENHTRSSDTATQSRG